MHDEWESIAKIFFNAQADPQYCKAIQGIIDLEEINSMDGALR